MINSFTESQEDYDKWRTAFHLFGIPIYWYSIIFLFAIIFSFIGAIVTAKRKKIAVEPIENCVIIVIPCAIVCARLWYVIGDLKDFHSFWAIFDLRAGGIAIQGGVIGGLVSGYFYFRWQAPKYNHTIYDYFDCIVPNILIGQAIGRWGNFMNQEVLGWEVPGGIPWLPSWITDHLHIWDKDRDGVVRVPLFLIESFFNVLGWIFIMLIFPLFNKKYHFTGIQGGLYFLYYGVLRGILENFRYSDYVMNIKGVPTSVILSIIFVISSIIYLIYRINYSTPKTWIFVDSNYLPMIKEILTSVSKFNKNELKISLKRQHFSELKLKNDRE
ncbi:prolipoprotein diacylglyceryl transferase [symbiont of Argiope bruennichi]|uniref:prolipoprotein diacylglyceryl transferase n=1 Tax=symbiont of Argiope bruennichi TaxID=2810479 RepID=UPI003DA36169